MRWCPTASLVQSYPLTIGRAATARTSVAICSRTGGRREVRAVNATTKPRRAAKPWAAAANVPLAEGTNLRLAARADRPAAAARGTRRGPAAGPLVVKDVGHRVDGNDPSTA